MTHDMANVTTGITAQFAILEAFQVQRALEMQKDHDRAKLAYLMARRLEQGGSETTEDEAVIAKAVVYTDRALTALKRALYPDADAELPFPDEEPGSWFNREGMPEFNGGFR